MKKRIGSLLLAGAMCMLPSIVMASNWWSNIQPTGQGDLGGMENTAMKVMGTVQTIGFVVAVIMIMWVGIKYLTAGAGEKAKVKDTMIPILVGAIMIVAATTIAGWLFGIANNPAGSNGGNSGYSSNNRGGSNYSNNSNNSNSNAGGGSNNLTSNSSPTKPQITYRQYD